MAPGLIHPPHFRKYILQPVLKQLNLWSPEAEELLMGTAAVESGFRYLHQVRGPAIGIFQMEPQTIRDLLGWVEKRPQIADLVRAYQINPLPAVDQCHGNLYAATVLARLYFYRIPSRLPKELRGWAAYWKRHYNTPLGKGTEQKFIDAYNRLIKPAT